MSIAEKLAAAYQDIGGAIKPDKTNPAQRYEYVSAVAVQAKVSKALAKHGLYIREACSDLKEWREVKTRNGSMGMAVIQQRVVITDGESEVTTVAYGSGSDSGDKAVMKAETAAMKYALAKAFCVGLGDDPEADESTDRNARGQDAAANAKQWFAQALERAKKPEHFDALEARIPKAPESVQDELRAMVKDAREKLGEAA